jgi:UDPglucose 6-dehydrogenase
MNVSIFGAGYVGLCTGALLAELGNNIVFYDIDITKVEDLKNGKIPIFEPGLADILQSTENKQRIQYTPVAIEAIKYSEIIFVCVPTPMNNNGSTNLTYLFKAINNIISNVTDKTIIVIKSTVPIGVHYVIKQMIKKVGYEDKLSIISNPEFLREGNAIYDNFNPDRIVIGYKEEFAKDKMLELYKIIDCPKICVDNTTAETIKYASNAFLATKISFINMISQVCDELGGNVKEVANAMGFDKRIGSKFLNAGIGYGGSCFAKDIASLIYTCEQNNINSSILRGTVEINDSQIDRVISKLNSQLVNLDQKNIVILGLAFKPNTDDLRDAPSIKLIKKLLTKGARVKAHDPIVGIEILEFVYPVEIIEHSEDWSISTLILPITYEADAIIIVTEWDIYKTIDWERIGKSMRNKLLFDCRNMLDPQKIINLGITYFGIGI